MACLIPDNIFQNVKSTLQILQFSVCNIYIFFILLLLTYLYLCILSTFIIGGMWLRLALKNNLALCFLVDIYIPFTFNVNIDIVRFKFIILFVFCLFHLFFVHFPLFLLLFILNIFYSSSLMAFLPISLIIISIHIINILQATFK